MLPARRDSSREVQLATSTQRQEVDLRSQHDKVRRLFEQFGRATGDEKKLVAQELMRVLPLRR